MQETLVHVVAQVYEHISRHFPYLSKCDTLHPPHKLPVTGPLGPISNETRPPKRGSNFYQYYPMQTVSTSTGQQKVWTKCKTEKFLFLPGIKPRSQYPQPLTLQTELFQFISQHTSSTTVCNIPVKNTKKCSHFCSVWTFWGICKIAKSDYQLCHVCLSVCSSVHLSVCLHGPT